MSARPRLYRDGDERYTEEAISLEDKMREALRPIMEKAAESGYSVRDVQLIGMMAAMDVGLDLVFRLDDKPHR